MILYGTDIDSNNCLQMDSEKPLLSLNGDKRLMLSPSVILQNKSSGPGSIDSSTEGLCAISNVELPLGRWTHIGCAVNSIASMFNK